MISITEMYEFYKQRYLQRLREELAKDLEDFLAEPPSMTLKDYAKQKPIVLPSGYTTNPASPTSIEVDNIQDEAS